jgi:hypothetical protein
VLPQSIPHKTSPAIEQKLLEVRDQIPCFGPQRLKRYCQLPCSTGAIGRILQQHGRAQRRKKPRKPARNLSALKMTWPAFGRVQIDVKDLSDLPAHEPLIPFGLPRYQFTHRGHIRAAGRVRMSEQPTRVRTRASMTEHLAAVVLSDRERY